MIGITEQQYDCAAETIYETLMPRVLGHLTKANISDQEYHAGLGTAIYMFSVITGKTYDEIMKDMADELMKDIISKMGSY